MTACDLKKIKVRWDQSGFERAKSGWSSERIEKDEKSLKEAFNQASRVPVLKEALAWAQAHGVKFFIDRTCVNVGGYYTPGSGVVAIAEKHTHFMQDFVRIIVHETRHAWQDHHGLLKRSPHNFAGYFIKNSLIEADAYAFEKRAEDECRLANLKRQRADHQVLKSLFALQENLADKESYLAGRFLEWFSSDRPKFYGDAASKHCGRFTGVYQGVMPENNTELRLFTFPLGSGIDITDTQRVLELGKAFSGRNYLAGLPHEVLSKKILSPTLAMSFYEAANDDQKQLTAALRKRELQAWSKFNLARAKHGFPRLLR
ncbi:MAG: hypothetical protein K8R48_07005 [Alphaproteobacteria bacterium]|nr:hypothetical protein [Alphaproteobacteria bacterium]